jgi:ferrous iron transport protein A
MPGHKKETNSQLLHDFPICIDFYRISLILFLDREALMANNITQLGKNQEADIRAVSGHAALSSRLQELGFTPGATIRLVAKAAFGGAMAFQVRGSNIALRRADAACIEI